MQLQVSQEHSQLQLIVTFLPPIGCILTLVILVLRALWKSHLVIAAAGQNEEGTDHAEIHDDTGEMITTISSDSHTVLTQDRDIETSSHVLQSDSTLPVWALELPPLTLPVLIAELGLDAGLVATHLTIILSDSETPTFQAFEAVTCRVYALLLCLVALLRIWTRKQLPTEIWLFRPFIYVLLLVEEIVVCLGDQGEQREQGWSILSKLHVADLVVLLLCLTLSVNVPRRGRVSLQWDKEGIFASPEEEATVFSMITFGWLNSFIWNSTGQSYELLDLYHFARNTRVLVSLEVYRVQKCSVSLVHNLIRFTGSYLLLQACWATLSAILTFTPVLLFQEILRYVEQPTEARTQEVWMFVALLFLLGIGKSLADGQAAWMGIKIYVRARGVLAGEIFAKALRRSVVDHSNKKDVSSSKSNIPSSSQSAMSNGHVMTLLSSDAMNIAEMGNSLYLLWVVVPIEFIIGMVLLYKILGYSSFIGLAVMVVLMPINTLLARKMSKLQKEVMIQQSARVCRVEELLLSIRAIKFQAWESFFKTKVNRAREDELACRNKAFALQSLMVAVYNTTPLLISIVSFLCYTLIAQKDLRASVAFPALSLFTLIRGPLDKFADVLAKVIQARLSAGRIDEYLHEPDKPTNSSPSLIPASNDTMSLSDGRFTWTSHEESEQFNLSFSKISLQRGKLNLIVGPTASGKSALLLALLGEMHPQIKGGHSETTVGTWKGSFLGGEDFRVAYCAQDAWLINDTIKENILFGHVFKPGRYKDVVSRCSLAKDLQILPDGDLTMVGEKGVMLSGGQKQRISLARALYSDANVLLLDDCLSAVDAETSRLIFHRAIKGPLTSHRTCLMVTHNIDLCIKDSDNVIVLENGKVITQGPPSSMATNDKLTRVISESTVQNEQEEETTDAVSLLNLHSDENGQAKSTTEMTAQAPQGSEYRNVGTIKLELFRFYFKMMGSYPFWIGTVIMLLINQLSTVANSLWVREWANAYQQTDYHLASYPFNNLINGIIGNTKQDNRIWAHEPRAVDVGYYLWVYAVLTVAFFFIKIVRMQVLFRGVISASLKIHAQLLNAIVGTRFSFFDRTPQGRIINRMTRDMKVIDQELAPVLLGLQHAIFSAVTTWIIIAVVTPLFILPGLVIVLCYYYLARYFLKSSRELKRLEAIQYSPIFQYFGETLSGFITIRAYGQQGRFMRKFARAVDEHTRPFMHVWASNAWLTLRVESLSSLIATFSAAFIVYNAKNLDPGGAGLSLTYAVTFTEHVLWTVRCYSMTEQNMNSVERIEEYVSLPQEQSETIKEVAAPLSKLKQWPSQGHVVFSNLWLRYADHLPHILKNIQLDIQPRQKVAIVGRTGAGKSSLSLSLLRTVEATSGSIIIDDIDISTIPLEKLRSSISYIPQDPTIFPDTLRINLDPFSEYTDDKLLSVLQQVMFIKSNASSKDCRILSTLITDNSGNSGSESNSTTNTQLNTNDCDNDDSEVDDNGAPKRAITLSSGQRQLICLARALLKHPKILIMDEATASIDYDTDSRIQKVLRQDFNHESSNSVSHGAYDDNNGENAGMTIITIAHRLQTIIDYDRVIVLDKGEVVEDGAPWILLEKSSDEDGEAAGGGGGIFASMCKQTGQFQKLKSLAKQAWEQQRSNKSHGME